MALLKQIELASGVKVEYHKIRCINFPDRETMEIMVEAYASIEARQAGKPAVEVKSYAVKELSVGPNVWITGYSELKALPEFEGYTDC